MAAQAMPSPRASPIRRFIYLIIDGGNDSHTVHRIDTSPLFVSGARPQHGPQASPPPPRAALPSPLARIGCTAGRQFLPLGRGVERLVGVDRHRHTVIVDTRTGAVRAGPDAHHGRPVCRHVWADVDGYYGKQAAGVWSELERSYLSYLGSGRFCVTRFFKENDKDGNRTKAAVVTAVEATRAAGEMHMVSRASVCYDGPECNPPCYWAPNWAYRCLHARLHNAHAT